MKKLNEKVIIATGIEMADANLCGKNTSDNPILWIYWKWDYKTGEESYAPIADIYFDKTEKCTHKIKNNEMYFYLPKSENGSFICAEFINKFIEIEELDATTSEKSE